METDTNVVVVGAGTAGLAAAAELGRSGIRALVLERANAVGASWRSRYDRLRLNSSRWFAHLPRVPYAKGTPVFPTREQVIDYLEDYSSDHRLDVRLGTQLERIDREAGGWSLTTSRGVLNAEHVIMAAGHDHTPHVPAWPGREGFAGTLIHSAEYRSAAPFEGSDVLVAGSGCSGMEIAYDLVSGGAGRVRLAVRTLPNMMLRSPAGPLIANGLRHLPPRLADRVARLARRVEIGDLTEFGLPVPEEGVFSRLHRLHVAPAIVDKPVVEAIRERSIEIVAGVEALAGSEVHLSDGERLAPDALVAATGYGCGLEPIVGHLGVLDEQGVPVAHGDEVAPGLRFVGYLPLPAHIGHMGREARRAATSVAGSVAAAAASPNAARIVVYG